MASSAMTAYAKRIALCAPPLSDEQRRNLGAIFRLAVASSQPAPIPELAPGEMVEQFGRDSTSSTVRGASS
jgi:hypothetical protein